MRGLSPVVASGGHSSSRCAGLSLSRPLLLRSTGSRRAGSRRAGSAIVAHGPSCSAACGILPDQGSNPCRLHRQADSQPLRHLGSPILFFLKANFNLLRSHYFFRIHYNFGWLNTTFQGERHSSQLPKSQQIFYRYRVKTNTLLRMIIRANKDRFFCTLCTFSEVILLKRGKHSLQQLSNIFKGCTCVWLCENQALKRMPLLSRLVKQNKRK